MNPTVPLLGGGRIQVEMLAHVPFIQKWELLKSVIQQHYVDENKKLPELVEIMTHEYGFTAAEHDYKYHFKKWGMRKNISKSKKDALVKIRQRRTEEGKGTAFEYKGRNVDDKKLRRQIKENMRRSVASRPTIGAGEGNLTLLSGSKFLVSNSIFLNWNIPYGTLRSSGTRAPTPSVFSPMSMSTPSDVVITTPPANNALSPNNAPSPFSRDQKMRMAIDRAGMLIKGQHIALVNSMCKEEKDIMSTWLYQFWLHSFKTAKHWGRGPGNWTAELLGFSELQAPSPVPFPTTPRIETEPTISHLSPSSVHRSNNSRTETISVPSQLCRWSIHYVADIKYEQLESRTPSPEPNSDLENEESWKAWPSSWEQPPLQKRLLNHLARNDFSNIRTESLPIAVSQMVKASEEENGELLEEAFGFSIMARNTKVLDSLLEDIEERSDEEIDKLRELNPFHLATSYLDGSKTCCMVLDSLFSRENLIFSLSKRNNLGYTVLDNLMIAILKSHTSITPGMVDDGLRDEKRFPGEEVDICGRWDADSDCVRELLGAGNSCIPFSWKHKFCHTSVQAICHSINYRKIFGEAMDMPSGLFIKRCLSCGLKMQLQPLHIIVLVAFSLAQFGTKDEDLFGALAVLLLMFREGANPLLTAHISPSALYPDQANNPEMADCSHSHLRPADLADLVPLDLVASWPGNTRIGWEIFCHVLRLSQKEWTDYEMSMGHYCRGENHIYSIKANFGHNRDLAKLSGAVEAEYLTYRRLIEGDPWISPYFNMRVILENLNHGEDVEIGLIENDMIHPVCNCGHLQSSFRGDLEVLELYAAAKWVERFHFSNLEDWSRTTFIETNVFMNLEND